MTSLSHVGASQRATPPQRPEGRGGKPPAIGPVASSAASATTTVAAATAEASTGDHTHTTRAAANAATPPSQNGLSSMGLPTQAFAGVMGQGKPPQPPHSAPGPQGTAAEQGQEPSLQDLDTDGNGSVSRSEFGLGSASTTVSSTDNGDGTTTSTYSVTTSTEDADDQALFDAVDADGNGALSHDEVQGFEKQMKAMLQQMQQAAAQQYGAVASAGGAAHGAAASSGSDAGAASPGTVRLSA